MISGQVLWTKKTLSIHLGVLQLVKFETYPWWLAHSTVYSQCRVFRCHPFSSLTPLEKQKHYCYPFNTIGFHFNNLFLIFIILHYWVSIWSHFYHLFIIFEWNTMVMVPFGGSPLSFSRNWAYYCNNSYNYIAKTSSDPLVELTFISF